MEENTIEKRRHLPGGVDAFLLAEEDKLQPISVTANCNLSGKDGEVNFQAHVHMSGSDRHVVKMFTYFTDRLLLAVIAAIVAWALVSIVETRFPASPKPKEAPAALV